jgi:hypothetical protein
MIRESEELKDRIESKRHALQARLAELRADTRAEARDKQRQIERSLDELEDYLKDGWHNLSEGVSAKLNSWLNRS